MRVLIVGHHLPGRTFPQPGGVMLTNVHVAVQVHADPAGPVPADAPEVRWELEVDVVDGADGGHDFRGPVVHGKRGERFIYLTWGEVGQDWSFHMFRRAKLMLNRIEPALIDMRDRTRSDLGRHDRPDRRTRRPTVCPGRPAGPHVDGRATLSLDLVSGRARWGSASRRTRSCPRRRPPNRWPPDTTDRS